MEYDKCNDGDKGIQAMTKTRRAWRAMKGDECIQGVKGDNGDNEVTTVNEDSKNDDEGNYDHSDDNKS